MTQETWTADDFSLDLTVNEDGAAKDITGATVEAVVGRSGTNEAVTATIADAPNGVVRVAWDEDTFASGTYTLQVRVTIGAETQTVYSEAVAIRRSLTVAA